MVTVVVKALPAVADVGALTSTVLAAAALTVTLSLPVMELVTVSVAVSEREPAVFRVMENVFTPLSVEVKV
jgi:hypothetical protein